MKSSNKIDVPSLVKNLAAQRNVEEINTFLKISQKIFDEKLTVIEEEMRTTKSQEERDLLKQKAIQLYREYKQSLTLMEECINEIYKKSLSGAPSPLGADVGARLPDRGGKGRGEGS